MVLSISPRLNVKNVRELVALAKEKPGQLNFGSLGIGTVLHLAGELFGSEAGVDIRHVPYKDAGSCTTDLASGQIEMAYLGLPTVAGLINAGKIKALAVTTRQRSSVLPNVPSISESLPGYSLDSWIGLIGPKGMSTDLTQRYFEAVKASLDDNQAMVAIGSQGLTSTLKGPPEAKAYFVEDMKRSAELVRRAGIVPQ